VFTRSINDVPKVEWGQGTSQRILTKADGMGFAVAHTVVRAGTVAKLQYKHHLEACYCIGGSGAIYLVSIFNPPINGDETHSLAEDGFSSYAATE